MTQEYKINNFITVKLENNDTKIYVKDQLFNQCKILLLEIPEEKLEKTEDISSIDEAKDQLSREMEKNKFIISPEIAFFGHCSNLQAWAENNYDTRLLLSNLSFPLLHKLVEVGDPMAKRVFKEEIASRFQEGFPPTMLFLIKEKYLHYLDEEERQALYTDVDYSMLPKYKVRDFLLVLKELYKRGIKEIKPYYISHLYSLFEHNTLEEVLDLLIQDLLFLLDKDEFLEFALYFLREVQHYKKTECYADVVGFFFELLQRGYFFDEEYTQILTPIWKTFFSLVIPEKDDEWSKIVQSLLVTSKFCNLVPEIILGFEDVFEKLNPYKRAQTLFFLMNHMKDTEIFRNHLPNFRHLLLLFFEQQKKIGTIYDIGTIYIELLSALRSTPFLQEFSDSLKESLVHILTSLEEKEDVNNSFFVHKLIVHFGFMQDFQIRDTLMSVLLEIPYYEEVSLVFDFHSIRKLMSDNGLENPEIDAVLTLMDYLFSLTSEISIQAFHHVRNSEWRDSREIKVSDIEKAISTIRSWQEK